jgi:hypothetical protein
MGVACCPLVALAYAKTYELIDADDLEYLADALEVGIDLAYECYLAGDRTDHCLFDDLMTACKLHDEG